MIDLLIHLWILVKRVADHLDSFLSEIGLQGQSRSSKYAAML